MEVNFEGLQNQNCENLQKPENILFFSVQLNLNWQKYVVAVKINLNELSGIGFKFYLNISGFSDNFFTYTSKF